jgi:hypothetical protein
MIKVIRGAWFLKKRCQHHQLVEYQTASNLNVLNQPHFLLLIALAGGDGTRFALNSTTRKKQRLSRKGNTLIMCYLLVQDLSSCHHVLPTGAIPVPTGDKEKSLKGGWNFHDTGWSNPVNLNFRSGVPF